MKRTSLDRTIHFSVEDHGGAFHLPIYDQAFLSQFPDLAVAEFSRLVEASSRTEADAACRPLPRADWPAACEARTAAALDALRAIVADLQVRRMSGSLDPRGVIA